MKKVLLFLFVGLFFSPLSVSAQNKTGQPLHSCGTSIETQEVLFRNMVEMRNRYPNVAASRAVSYIPVWFHLAAKSDGTGRTTTRAGVAEMLCAWNKLYETNGLEMQFYIKGFSEIDFDKLYDAPQSFSGSNKMTTTKKADAMNVYITNNAGDGSRPDEITLAYYSNRTSSADPEYTNDWIVCTSREVNAGSAATIAHEAGHMFTLAHTFYGWEGGKFEPTPASPCAPVNVSYNGRVVEVEKAARTGLTKNCATAADGFCDTPPDYLFGLGYSGPACNYSGIAKDPDCVAFDTDETNLMSYFLGCIKNFSGEQKAAIRNNFLNHPRRAYLRNAATPPLTAATPTLGSPALGATTAFFNNVSLDWDNVPNAFGYTVEVSRFTSFSTQVKSFYVTNSDFNINALNSPGFLIAGTRYYWRVKSVVPYANCANVSATGNFITGTVNAVNEIAGVTQFTVSPNPLNQSQNLSLEMNSEAAFEAKIKLVNMTGQMMKTEKRTFAAGYSTQAISIANLTNGTYILSVESDKGVLNKRIVIQ